MRNLPKHPQGSLWPSEVITVGQRHARKGVGNRACPRWLWKDSQALFPRLPERPRLLRLFRPPQAWPAAFLAAPTVLGGLDPYGVEVIHPIREGRSTRPIGRKGLSYHRGMIGGPLRLVLNQWGWVVAGVGATATVPAKTFQWLMRQGAGRLRIVSDTACHAADGEPPNRTRCRRGAWQDRIRIQTVWSMRTVVSHCTKVTHWIWAYCHAWLAFTMVALHVLVPWHG